MTEYLWTLNKDGKWEKLTDLVEVQINKCLQEIALWLGENPMNIYQGVDYQGVRDRRVFLKKSIDDVVENYRLLFDNIEISDPVYKDDIVECSITFTKNQVDKTYNIDYKG